MKTKALLFGIALGMGLMSCDDMLPNPEPTQNPEQELFASTGLAIERVGSDDTPLNLDKYAADGERVILAKITKLENFPSTYDLVMHVEFSNTEDFAKKGEFTAAIDGENIVASPSVISDAIGEAITRDPAQIKLYTSFTAYAVQGTSSMRLGGANYSYGDYTYTVDPLTPSQILSKQYYLFSRQPGATTWASEPMGKTEAGISVYDDGVFTAILDVPADGMEWAVGSNAETPDYSIRPATAGATSGSISLTDEAVEPGVIAAMSPYLITIDVLKNTYSYSLAFECLYVPGGATSSSNFDSVLKLFPNNSFTRYSGTMRLYNSFYFTGQPSNTGVAFMRDGDVKVDEKTGIMTGKYAILDKAGDKTFNASNGLYYIEVNITDQAVKVVPIKSIQIIGDLNSWNTETAAELTSASRFRTWTIKDVALEKGQKFKFCVDHSWDYSFGGSMTDIVQNGGDMTVEESGVFDVTLDFSKQPNTVTLTRK